MGKYLNRIGVCDTIAERRIQIPAILLLRRGGKGGREWGGGEGKGFSRYM